MRASIGVAVRLSAMKGITFADDRPGCNVSAHSRCAGQVCLVCPAAFNPEQVRAAFVRCFASLFYTYRRFLHPASGDRKKAGLIYHFNMDGFLKSMPHENAEYMQMLQQTQGWSS